LALNQNLEKIKIDMKKTLLFIFFASFLLVDLFSTAKIVEAAYIGVT
jgi:hypothetical protein